jgi:SAM-dependent methyltransferase
MRNFIIPYFLMGFMILEEEIRSYLKEEGIEKLKDDDVVRKLGQLPEYQDIGPERFRSSNGSWDRLFSRPKVYPLMQCFSHYYNGRVSFLSHMVGFIYMVAAQKSDLVVVDAGCATGLDVRFLAKHYLNEKHNIRFKGYDISPELIRIATQKVNKKGLKNIDFTRESHAHPIRKEFADIIYTVNAFGSDALNNPSMLHKLAQGVASRVRKGGVVIFSYHVPFGQKLPLELNRNQFTPIVSEFLDRTRNAMGEFEMVSDYYQVN